VEMERHYIHFSKNQFMFAPVPVGELRSPIQIYEMYNGGAQPVTYRLDVSPLEQLCKVLLHIYIIMIQKSIFKIRPNTVVF